LKSISIIIYSEEVRGAAVLSGGGEVWLWSQGMWRIVGGLWWSRLVTSEEVVFVGVRLLAAYKE